MILKVTTAGKRISFSLDGNGQLGPEGGLFASGERGGGGEETLV